MTEPESLPRPHPDLMWEHLHNLRDFLLVAQTGSFAGAARVSNRTASVVIRNIQTIEENLGVRLFERRSSGALLNELGKAVERRVQRISDEITASARLYSGDGRSGPTLNALSYVMFSSRKLQIVLTLAETGNVKQCAQRLGLSQPGVSMAMSRLEESIGEPLFSRTKQGFIPTGKTEALLGHIYNIAREIRSMLDEVDSLMHGVSGTVVLGLLAVARIHLLPAAVLDVHRQYPNVRVRTVQAAYDKMLEQLEHGLIDFVVGVESGVPQDRGLTVEIIAQDELGIFVRAGHPLLADPPKDLARMENVEWILPRRNSPSWALIEGVFEAQGLKMPEAVVETTDVEFSRGLILGSELAIIVSPKQFAHELTTGSIRQLAISMPNTRRDIALVRRENDVLSPAAEALLDATRAQASRV